MSFMDKNFLLKSDLAVKLYENYCKDLPIFDYHCHLSAEEIYYDRPFRDLYEVWLKGDHYKWRLMRLNGTPEEAITGSYDPYRCFSYYVAALEKAADHPLYHWSHLELKRCFGIEEVISRDNMDIIWNKANYSIKELQYSPRKAIKAFNVKTLITTEEIFSSLEFHKRLIEDRSFETAVLPAFRGDKLLNADSSAIMRLAEVAGKNARTLTELIECVGIQLDRFTALGAVVADMALEGYTYIACDLNKAAEIYIRLIAGEAVSQMDRDAYRTYMLLHLMREYYKRGWAVLLHIGAKRNNNTALFKKLGPDVGADSVSDAPFIDGVNKLLDQLNTEGLLGKTVLFNLNSADNSLIATTVGNFAGDKARLQMGMAWWFSDNKHGIRRMLKDYASLGLIGNFLGMLTDSRSFISYTRHEYFRRLFCDYIAKLVNNGEFTDNPKLLEELITGVGYYNAKNYFTGKQE